MRICSAIMFGLFLTTPVHAQDTISNVQREIDRLQERERERLRESERQFEQSQIAPPTGAVDDVEENSAADGVPCQAVTRVEIIGMTLYDPQSFLEDTADLIGPCISANAVTELRRKITNTYVRDGYITSQAFVSAKPSAPDVLTIQVIEGTVGAIITCSFAGDTLVRTIYGLTPIRDIKAGTDWVWARDQRTGAMGYRLVEAQYSNPYDVTVRIVIRDVETGREQTLVSNAIHPVFVQLPEGATAPPSSEGHVYDGSIVRGAWVDAANLKPGHRLLNDDGSWAVVEAVSSTPEALTAYNLKVSDFHTYFVTGNAQAEPVWVHNTCDPDNFAQRLRETPPRERRAFITTEAINSAQSLGFTRVDASIARRNPGRTIYVDPATGNYYSVDFKHGGFEHFTPSGVHLGEIRFDGSRRPTKPKPTTHRIKL